MGNKLFIIEDQLSFSVGLLQSDVTDPDDIAAVAGYNNGQNSSNYFMLPNSGTNSVTEWATTSNIGVPGLWIFPGMQKSGTPACPLPYEPIDTFGT